MTEAVIKQIINRPHKTRIYTTVGSECANCKYLHINTYFNINMKENPYSKHKCQNCSKQYKIMFHKIQEAEARVYHCGIHNNDTFNVHIINGKMLYQLPNQS